MKQVTPSVHCPHCHAFAHQYWYSLRAKTLTGERPFPSVVIDRILDGIEGPDDEKYNRLKRLMLANLIAEGNPFIWRARDTTPFPFNLWNLNLSEC